ncbi:MAG: YhbY family RNA-binding protein [Clostridiales bacterium]|jgi:RNA-binding protein|nr:YhbY family RNA-binding protein [Clostridiales bacterium]
MLTSRQRAYLRALANPLETIFQIGKSGLNDHLTVQIGEALEAREMVKVHVLESALLTPREAAEPIAAALNADIVQTIGTRFTLYRESRTLPVEKRIRLPK